MEALHAELASVARLLGTQAEGSLSTRDLNDILHLITLSSDLRARLEKPCSDLSQLAPYPHTSSSYEAHPASFSDPAPITIDPTTTIPHYPPSGPRDPHPSSSHEARHPSSSNPTPTLSVDRPTTVPPSALPGHPHHSHRNMAGPYPTPYTHVPGPQGQAGESKKPFWGPPFRLTRRMGCVKRTKAV